ncbi:MAG: ArsR/SmtB family transcription factor, partial [Bdellovibrionota bacterium]
SPEERLDELDAVFSALAHRARRQILMALRFRDGAMSAGDIAKRFAHAWPTTTRHLRVLEVANLVTHEQQGTSRIYRINTRKLGVLEEWLSWFEERNKSAPGKANIPKSSR